MNASTTHHHKDSPPRETIARVRGILEERGILLREAAWQALGDGWRAVQLVNVDLPGSFSAGKGVSEELALASAYAEYVERIQNLAGTPFLRKYGNMPFRIRRPDEVEVSLGALLESEGDLMARLLGDLAGSLYPETGLLCVPFFDVFAGRTRLLPDIVYEACQGNGLCAGNTPEEAMVQGLCEVFERHVVGKLYRGELAVLPTIPHDALEHLGSFPLVKEMLDSDYGVVIKDCSLGGRFPVVGTVVVRPDENRYRAYFGSAPDLDTALQRCVTEWFQGTGAAVENMNPIRWADPPVDPDAPRELAFSGFCNRGTERFLPALFAHGEDPRHEQAFSAEHGDNRSALSSLAGILEREGLELLVRDASFLGFPSYAVYVPGLAETEIPLVRESLEHRDARADLRSALLDLAGATPEQLTSAATTLERILADPELYDHQTRIVGKLAGIQVEEGADFEALSDVDYLLTLLHSGAGDDAAAARALTRCLERGGERGGFVSDNPEYHWCAAATLALRGRGVPSQEVTRILSGMFTDELAEELEEDLSHPEQPFRNCSVPRCRDCATCAVERECRYPAWLELAEVLQRGLNEASIDQMGLAEIFERVLRGSSVRGGHMR